MKKEKTLMLNASIRLDGCLSFHVRNVADRTRDGANQTVKNVRTHDIRRF